MSQSPAVGTDTQSQNLIDRGLNGNATAHEALLNHACDRLLRLTRKMFHGYCRKELGQDKDAAADFDKAEILGEKK